MLNADDQETGISLRQLRDVVSTGTKPIVFWIGAGSSRWLEYPSWKGLTLQLRRDFASNVLSFNNQQALEFINKERFPEVFQLCKNSDPARYRRFIADAFLPRKPNDSYMAFVNLLTKIEPLYLMTTNVDEVLEHSLPLSVTLQRSDLQRCVELVQKRSSFAAKLHGSVSSVETTVFATSDYNAIISDPSYLQMLKYIFMSCTVVFLGYSVRDGYVVRLLQENAVESDLFGPGPHFVVTNEPVPVRSLHRIRYAIKLHPDHRAALSVLDYISQSSLPRAVASVGADGDAVRDLVSPILVDRVPPGKTAYYISDLQAPGTWSTSAEITAHGKDEDEKLEASFGLGFTNDEVPFTVSTALHDLAVALICFDYIYLPLMASGHAFGVLGEEIFRELLQSDVIRFIHDTAQLGVVFYRLQEPIGTIANVTAWEKGSTEPQHVSAILRRTFNPVAGKEREAQHLLDVAERQTTIYRRSNEIDLPFLTRCALVMPAVSGLLGIGSAILPSQAPRWLRYSYLRLAHLVQTAALCTEYGIQAAKVPLGGVHLTSAAFGVQATDLQAEHLASYMLAGPYHSGLGGFLQQDMSIVRQILRFRVSAEGVSLRQEIGQILATQGGREFSAAVNAGLSRTIPTEVLRRAKDRLETLMTERPRVTPVPAVWGSALQSDSSTRLWRAKSQKILLEMCSARGIGKNDPCICGSRDPLRLCCLPPLMK